MAMTMAMAMAMAMFLKKVIVKCIASIDSHANYGEDGDRVVYSVKVMFAREMVISLKC